MNQYKKKMYDLSGPKTAEALNKRHFEAYYCSTAAEAVEKVLELTPKTDVVSWGGAMTVDELGIKQRMAQEGYTLLDRDTAQTPEEKQAIMRQALTCGTFLMSSNAISKDGQLVNIDGNGNRVAAMCFGPRQVVVVAGMNKVLGTLDDAVARARNVAAPANAQRPYGTVRRLHQPRLHLLQAGHHPVLYAGAPHQGRSGGRGSGSVSKLPKRGNFLGNQDIPSGTG